MKVVFFVASILLSLPLFSKDKDYKMSCKQFRTGKFVMEDDVDGKTIIDRYDSVQIETMVKYNFTIELHIRWVDECTYVLTFSKVIKDPDNNTSGLYKTMVLTNSITQVTGNSYTQTTSSNENPAILVFKLTKVK